MLAVRVADSQRSWPRPLTAAGCVFAPSQARRLRSCCAAMPIDAHGGNYGVVRRVGPAAARFACPSWQSRPAAPRTCAALGHVLPELIAKSDSAALLQFADPAEFRPLVQAALREWVQEGWRVKNRCYSRSTTCRASTNVSAALIALLARSAGRASLLIVADPRTTRRGARKALGLLAETADSLELSSLNDREVSALLASVVCGEVPNLEIVR